MVNAGVALTMLFAEKRKRVLATLHASLGMELAEGFGI
jgi:hypothetical protein